MHAEFRVIAKDDIAVIQSRETSTAKWYHVLTCRVDLAGYYVQKLIIEKSPA